MGGGRDRTGAAAFGEAAAVVVHGDLDSIVPFAAGKQALNAGKSIQYVGAIGTIILDKWHNASGAYEAVRSPHGQPKIIGTVSSAQISRLKGGA